MNASTIMCTSSINSEYFLSYELINKYKISSLFFVPKVEKVSIIISVLDLLNNALSTIKNSEIKLYLLLYIVFLRTPIITLNKNIVSRGGKTSSTVYYLKTTLADSLSISEFFISVFFENWHKIRKEGALFEAKNTTISCKNVFYHFKVFTDSIAFFRKLSIIFDLIFDFKEVFFHITLRLKHPVNILKPSGIKSFPFFWIND